MLSPATRESNRRDVVEIIATVVLALAAVATAWSSYQATRWNGEQAKAASRANALRIDAARAEGLAEAMTEIDVATFVQWVDATATENEQLAAFYRARFRPEFVPAFDAWLASNPLTDPAAPATPFVLDEYRLEAATEAERLDADAEAETAAVRRNIQRAANYVFAVVLFAVALFFAGMSIKLRGQTTRRVLIGIGCAVFVGAAAWISTFPTSVSV